MNIYYVAGIPYSDELYHHGIKGQKWGIRRYQNPDGTLTPAGEKRYSQFERALKDNKTDTRNSNSVKSDARKILDKYPELERQYGNDVDKNAWKISKKAKIIYGEDTSNLEKRIRARDDHRIKNAKSINLGYRTSEGKKLADSGHTVSNTILNGIGKTVAMSALTYGSYKLTTNMGMNIVPQMIKKIGFFAIGTEVGTTIGRAIQIKDYNQYDKLKRSK